MIGLIGRKLGMTHVFTENGNQAPVTVVEVGPCPVVQVTGENGKGKAQLAFDPITKKDERKVTKPLRGHYLKANVKPHRFLREFPLEEADAGMKAGDSVNLDIFKDVHYVSVSGISKGRGFAGVMKRHGFKGAQTMSHGTHENFRHGGSIGMCEEPARVHKGMKMPGHFGSEKVTTLNLEIIKMFPEKNLLLIKGAAPGPNGGVLIIERSDRREKKAAKVAGTKFVNPLKASKRKGG